MIAHTNKISMKRNSCASLVIATMTLLFFLATITSTGALAYFEFDHDQLWGDIEKTKLSDGRIRHKSSRFENAKIPDSIREAIEKNDEKMEYDPKTMHFSGHYDVTWNPEYKVFKLEDHLGDMTKMVCHENGDINMRLSLFGVSVELTAALKANDDFPVILHASAQHQCHGQPIFRKIESVHFVTGSDEVLLVTSKAKYEEMWSDADIDISFQHPTLTHVDSHKAAKKFDASALDHGADWNAAPSTQGASLVRRNPSLTYRREEADNDEGGLFSKKTGSHFYQVPGYKASNGVISKHESAERKAHAQWGCCKCCKKIVKVVKKVTKPIKKVAKKATTAVKGVAKATGKGIVSAANAIASMLSISVSMDKTLRHTFSSCDQPGTSKLCDKPMIGLLFTFEMKFTTTFRFKFRISSNKLKLFHTALTGALAAGAGARTQSYQDGSGQVKILTIPGPRIKFMISVVPVWIDVSFPILGGVSITYGTKDTPFSAGYDISASATIGVEWTSSTGFTMLTSRNFEKGYKLDYPKTAPAQINVAPYIGVQARFALYSMIVGYPQIQFGLDNDIRISTSSYCKLRLYSKFFIKLSAGLDLELIIKKITIFHKGYGPWDLYKWTRPVYNYCMRQLPKIVIPRANRAEEEYQLSAASSSTRALVPVSTHLTSHMSQEEQMMMSRDALTLGDTAPPPTTELDSDDSGKVWTSNFTCGDTYYEFDVTGYFGGSDNFTFFFVQLSRNITNKTAGEQGGSNYTLASQSFLAFMDRRVTLGLDFIAVIVEATEEVASQLNMTWDDLSDLYTANSGNPNVQSLPLTYINVTFSSTNLDDAVFFNPNLCSGKKMSANESGASESQNVQSKGTFAEQIMERLVPQLTDSFLYLITDTLAIVLSIAVIEIVIIIFLPRIIGAKFFPRRHEEPRYREYVYGIVAVVIGIICYLCFVIGGALQYAEIVGAKVDPSYSPPPPGAPQGDLLTASGVEVIRYEFQGAEITVGKCPQFYPCSPNCRDLCEKRSFQWSNCPWPYCPSSSIITDEPGTTCQPWAWDAIISAAFSFIFLLCGCALPLLKFSNIYRRMPLSNAFLLLSGMCLCLLQRRIDSFLVEVTRDYFGPANDMITPYTLYMNGTSVQLFTTAMTVFWILCGCQGLVTVHELLQYYKETKDGKIVLHLDENLMDDIEAQQMRDHNGKSSETNSVSSFSKELNESQTPASKKTSSDAAKALPIAVPQYDF